MDEQGIPPNWSKRLLLTKLRPPRPASDDVVRPRLMDEIERGAERKLTLVVSPPGYGKSTLLSRWQFSTDRASGWLSLDESDNDFFVFMEYLVASIQSIDPCMCLETAAMLDAPSSFPKQQLLHSMLNEITASTRPLVLIFDDYHMIRLPEVQNAVQQIIQGMPVNMAIVIASRHEPELPTLQMSARGELIELSLTDLSFTAAETSEFLLQRQGLDLTAAEVDSIAQWAEGWPVALRLVSPALRGRSRDQIRALLATLSDNVPSISEYLWDEVLRNLPADQRTLLLQTSIVPQFNLDLAAAVSGNPAVGEILRGFAKDNLFIARLDGPGNWYRYHHLFAEVLLRRLQDGISASDVRALHLRAADWFAEHGQANDAASHAVLAQDWPRAAAHLLPICQELYDQGRIGTLRVWLQDLPDELFVIQPRLAYFLAWSLIRSGHRQAAARPISLARNLPGKSGDPALDLVSSQIDLLDSVYNWDLAGQAIARSLLERLGPDQVADRARTLIMLGLLQETGGDLAGAATSLDEARILSERSGLRGLHVLELNVTAGQLLAMGKLKEPAELFRRVIAIGDEWNDLPVQNAHQQLGAIFLEWNRLDEARDQAMATIEVASKMDSPIHLPSAHMLLARLAAIAEDWDAALDEIGRSIAWCARAELWGPLVVLEERQCRIWLAANQLTLAHRWLDKVGPAALESERYEDLPTTLTAMRVRIHEDRGTEIAPHLDRLAAKAEMHGWTRELLTIRTLRAIVENDRGASAAAQSAIDEAIGIGSAEGFLRSYLDEGPRVLPVLRLAARPHGPHQHHASAVLAAAGESIPAMPAALDQTPAILSARERDVMRLVALGLSNRAIGDALFISEETVKTHLRRIFEKLEVSSRTQAIYQAQQLGLV